MPAPRISYEDFRPPSAPGPTLLPISEIGAAAGGFAHGVAKLADFGVELALKEQQQQNNKDVSDALIDANDKLDTYRRELDTDPDTAGRPDKFRLYAEKLRSEKLGGFKNKPAQNDFYGQYNRMAGTMNLQVKHDARDDARQSAQLTLVDSLNANGNKAVFARTPEEAQVYLDQNKDMIRNAVTAGTISAVKARELERSVNVRIDAAKASELIRRNPAMAIQALRDPDQFKSLDAPTRAELLSRAQTRSEHVSAQVKTDAHQSDMAYRAAKQWGQPVSPEMEAEWYAKQKAAGRTKQADETRTFFGAVDHYRNADIPALERGIAGYEATGKFADLAIARHLRGQVEGERKEAAKQLDADIKLIAGYYDKGAVVPQDIMDRVARTAGDLGLTENVNRIIGQFGRLQEAERGGIVGIQAAISKVQEPLIAGARTTYTPEDLAELSALNAALVGKIKERDADPMAFAAKYNSVANEKYLEAARRGDEQGMREAEAALLEYQRQNGVRADKVQLFTNAQLEALHVKLTGDSTADQMAAAQALRNQVGDDPQLWGAVQRQFARANLKLPEGVEVVMSLPTDARDVRENIARAYKMNDKELKAVIGDQRFKDIGNAVEGAGDNVRQAWRRVPNGGADFYERQQAVATQLARYYAATGNMSDDAATKRAWEDIATKRWDFTAGPGVRLPLVDGRAIYDRTSVQRRLTATLNEVTTTANLDVNVRGYGVESMSVEQQRAAMRHALRNGSYWVPLGPVGKEHGVVLMASDGTRVTVGGAPVYVPYAPPVSELWADRAAYNVPVPQTFTPGGGQFGTPGRGEYVPPAQRPGGQFGTAPAPAPSQPPAAPRPPQGVVRPPPLEPGGPIQSPYGPPGPPPPPPPVRGPVIAPRGEK